MCKNKKNHSRIKISNIKYNDTNTTTWRNDFNDTNITTWINIWKIACPKKRTWRYCKQKRTWKYCEQTSFTKSLRIWKEFVKGCFQKDISDKSKTQLRHIQKIMKDIVLYFTKKLHCNIMRKNNNEGYNNASIMLISREYVKQQIEKQEVSWKQTTQRWKQNTKKEIQFAILIQRLG